MSATVLDPPAPPRARPRLTIRPATALAWIILICLLACAFFPGAIAPYGPLKFDYRSLLKPPSLAHPFGTDNFGRDILSRVIWATRVDLQIAIFSTLFPVLFGTFVGALVGYFRGVSEIILLRLVDLLLTVPFLVLVIAIVAVLGPGLVNMYVAVSAVGWVFYARLMRAEILGEMRRDYPSAARGLGYGWTRILFWHLVPNAIVPIVIYLMTDMALCILLGSSLGYLGLGAQPPTAEWGVLIADGKNFMTTAWWMSVFPGIAIVLAGIGFSLLGNSVAALLRRRP
ncbi:MAG: ABC transporter permease [Janthinobacterium lividum]